MGFVSSYNLLNQGQILTSALFLVVEWNLLNNN